MQNNPYRFRIGVMTPDFHRTMGGIKPGSAVLFYDATTYKDGGTCVIALPMSDEMIAKQRERGSLITTWCCCVGVKIKHIEEILM
jgi:hypothetical protein